MIFLALFFFTSLNGIILYLQCNLTSSISARRLSKYAHPNELFPRFLRNVQTQSNHNS